MGSNIVRLVPCERSIDTIRTLGGLLLDAEGRPGEPKLIGIAYVAMYEGREYIVDIAGETKRSPTFTRGMLLLLDDELASIVRGPVPPK